jgi:hypothetical protein
MVLQLLDPDCPTVVIRPRPVRRYPSPPPAPRLSLPVAVAVACLMLLLFSLGFAIGYQRQPPTVQIAPILLPPPVTAVARPAVRDP